jgi:2-haloacid dehalogenase
MARRGLDAAEYIRPPVADRWATFDCYGTLVDWERGIADALAVVWPGADVQGLLRTYDRVEPLVEEEGELSYRQVMARSLAAIAAMRGLEVPPGRSDALAESLPGWPVFEEVPGALAELREAGWKLAILSNTDPDLLAASIESIGVPFELAITAREAGAYKPALGHWRRFYRESGADAAHHVHVAASLFHDIEPAGRMGIRTVWINRAGEASDLPRAAELPDLSGLPQVLADLA